MKDEVKGYADLLSEYRSQHFNNSILNIDKTLYDNVCYIAKRLCLITKSNKFHPSIVYGTARKLTRYNFLQYIEVLQKYNEKILIKMEGVGCSVDN